MPILSLARRAQSAARAATHPAPGTLAIGMPATPTSPQLDVPLPGARARRCRGRLRFCRALPRSSLAEAWHAMSVELDGRRHWQRRVPTS